MTRHLEPFGVARKPGDNNRARPGHFGREHAAESLLSGPLNENALARAGASLDVGPLPPVTERERHCRLLGRNMRGNFVEDRVGMKIKVLAKAAPERRRSIDRSGTIARRIRGVVNVGFVAHTEIAGAAILAKPAREVFFQGNAVAFFDAPLLGGNFSYLDDDSNILVPHDMRSPANRSGVGIDIAAADSRGFYFQQAGIDGNVGKAEFPRFGLLGPDLYCGEYFFCHKSPLVETGVLERWNNGVMHWLGRPCQKPWSIGAME